MSQPPSTATRPTQEVIEAFYAGALRGDVAAVSTVLHPDVVIQEPASLPYGGDHKGREAALALLGTLFAGVDRDAVVIEHLVCGDRAAAAMLSVPFRAATGPAATMLVCETFEVSDGLITRIRPYYFDTAALLAAMG
jgi:ketosteroid isomerase-like protein